jgi:hypothetical protein
VGIAIRGVAWFLACFAVTAAIGAAEPETIRVMTFNLWHGGNAGGQPLEQTINVIKSAQADIVGLQEMADGNVMGGSRTTPGPSRTSWHGTISTRGLAAAS